MYTQHGTLLLFVLFRQPIYKDTKSWGTKVARKFFSMRKQAWLNCKQLMLYLSQAVFISHAREPESSRA